MIQQLINYLLNTFKTNNVFRGYLSIRGRDSTPLIWRAAISKRGSKTSLLVPARSMSHACMHTLSYLVIPCHTLSYLIIHCHTLSYIVIHSHTQSYIFIHDHTSYYIVIHCHTLSYIVVRTYILTRCNTHAHIHAYIHTHT